MVSYGEEVICPGCDAPHIIRVGDINAHRQIEFGCSSRGGAVTMEHDGSNPAITPAKVRKPLHLNFKSVG